MLYCDGTDDKLEVQLGTTACKKKTFFIFLCTLIIFIVISGQRAFEILPQELKELAFKTQVQYAAHPYLWMSKAKSRSTGLGMVSEGKELTPEELPDVEPEYVKIYPMVNCLFV